MGPFLPHLPPAGVGLGFRVWGQHIPEVPKVRGSDARKLTAVERMWHKRQSRPDSGPGFSDSGLGFSDSGLGFSGGRRVEGWRVGAFSLGPFLPFLPPGGVRGCEGPVVLFLNV